MEATCDVLYSSSEGGQAQVAMLRRFMHEASASCWKETQCVGSDFASGFFENYSSKQLNIHDVGYKQHCWKVGLRLISDAAFYWKKMFRWFSIRLMRNFLITAFK